jgi:hypothetical protein
VIEYEMTDDRAANQLGTDLSIRLMLRMVFEILGGMANDPDTFRADITARKNAA